MQAISVNPSVATLTDNRLTAHAAARTSNRSSSAGAHQGPMAVTGTVPRILVHALRRALDPQVSMHIGHSVTTPRGPITADVVLEGRTRRIAVQIADEPSPGETLLLVYGGFDAVYRVSAHDATWNVTAATALLEAAESDFFRVPGVAQMAAMSSVRRIVTGRSTLLAESWNGAPCGVLHRRRINRHGDWVATFEALIGQPEDQRRAS